MYVCMYIFQTNNVVIEPHNETEILIFKIIYLHTCRRVVNSNFSNSTLSLKSHFWSFCKQTRHTFILKILFITVIWRTEVLCLVKWMDSNRIERQKWNTRNEELSKYMNVRTHMHLYKCLHLNIKFSSAFYIMLSTHLNIVLV